MPRYFCALFQLADKEMLPMWAGKQCDKLLFTRAHPKKTVIASQCAHWRGNPPVEKNQVTIITKNRGNAHPFGYFSEHSPSNRGIATTT